MKPRIIIGIVSILVIMSIANGEIIPPSNFDPTPELIENDNYVYFKTVNWGDEYYIGFDKSNSRLKWGFRIDGNLHMVGEMIPILYARYNSKNYVIPLQGSPQIYHTDSNDTIYISVQNAPVTAYNYNDLSDTINTEVDVNWYNLTFDGTDFRLKFDIDHDNLGLFSRTGFGFIFVPSDELIKLSLQKTYNGMSTEDLIEFILNDDRILGKFNWEDIYVDGSNRFSEIKTLNIDGENKPTLMVGYLYPDARQWYLDPTYFVDYSPAPAELLSVETGISYLNDSETYRTNITDEMSDGSDVTRYYVSSNTTLAYDGLESGDLGGGVGWLNNWTVVNQTVRASSTAAYSGTYSLEVSGVTGADIDKPKVYRNMTIYNCSEGINVSFWRYGVSWEAGEKATFSFVDASGDEYALINWVNGDDTSVWTEEWYFINSSEYNLSGTVSFIFNATFDATGDDLFIDDFYVDLLNETAIVGRWNETYESNWEYFARVRKVGDETYPFYVCSYNTTDSLSGNCTIYDSFGGTDWYNINVTDLVIEEKDYGLGFIQLRLFGNSPVMISELYLRKEINDTDPPVIQNCSVNDTYLENNEVARFQCNYTDNVGVDTVESEIDGESYDFVRGDEGIWYYDYACELPTRWINFTLTNTTDLSGNENGTFIDGVASYCNYSDYLDILIHPNSYSYYYGDDMIVNALINYNSTGEDVGSGGSFNFTLFDPSNDVIFDNRTMEYVGDGNYRFVDFAESIGEFGQFRMEVYGCDQYGYCGFDDAYVEIDIDKELYIEYNVSIYWNESATYPKKYYNILQLVNLTNSHPLVDIDVNVVFDPLINLVDEIISINDSLHTDCIVYHTMTHTGDAKDEIHCKEITVNKSGSRTIRVWYANSLYFALIAVTDSFENVYNETVADNYEYIVDNTDDQLVLNLSRTLYEDFQFYISTLIELRDETNAGNISADRFLYEFNKEFLENRRHDDALSNLIKIEEIRHSIIENKSFNEIYDRLDEINYTLNLTYLNTIDIISGISYLNDSLSNVESNLTWIKNALDCNVSTIMCDKLEQIIDNTTYIIDNMATITQLNNVWTTVNETKSGVDWLQNAFNCPASPSNAICTKLDNIQNDLTNTQNTVGDIYIAMGVSNYTYYNQTVFSVQQTQIAFLERIDELLGDVPVVGDSVATLSTLLDDFIADRGISMILSIVITMSALALIALLAVAGLRRMFGRGEIEPEPYELVVREE